MGLQPTIGRLVQYTLTAVDAERVNRRRTDGQSIIARMKDDRWPEGAQAHVGNAARGGDIIPCLVVRVWPGERVNGQAFLDGNDVLWVNSADPSNVPQPGCWHWPERG